MSDARIERVARAIYEAEYGGEEYLWGDAHERLRQLARIEARAAIAAIEADSGWQPIDSAPKDGTGILLFDGKIFIGHWREAEYVTESWNLPSRWVDIDHDELNPQPTHWRPLPEPPSETGA